MSNIQPGKRYANEQAKIEVLVKFIGNQYVTYAHIINGQVGNIPQRMRIEEFARYMKEV